MDGICMDGFMNSCMGSINRGIDEWMMDAQ